MEQRDIMAECSTSDVFDKTWKHCKRHRVYLRHDSNHARIVLVPETIQYVRALVTFTQHVSMSMSKYNLSGLPPLPHDRLQLRDLHFVLLLLEEFERITLLDRHLVLHDGQLHITTVDHRLLENDVLTRWGWKIRVYISFGHMFFA